MSNFHRYAHGLRYLFTDRVPGFRLHALRTYPYAVKSPVPGDTIVVEVFEITDPQVERAIHALELGAGYVYKEVLVRDKPTGIYLFENHGPEPLVNDGDWVKFFGSR